MTQFDSTTLAQLRRDLAYERSMLRQAQDRYAVVKADAEQDVLDGKGGDPKALGGNERDRDRAYVLGIQTNPAYLAGLEALRMREAEVDRLQAAIDGLRDARRDYENDLRERELGFAADMASRSTFSLPHLRERAS